MEVLISIKPEFVKKIMCGEKKIELRRRIFKKDVSKVWVYTTAPVQKIEGYFEIDGIISDTPSSLWTKHKDVLGIDKEQYFTYFKNKDTAFGIKIKKWVNMQKEMNTHPPQSYIYLHDKPYIPPSLFSISDFGNGGDKCTPVKSTISQLLDNNQSATTNDLFSVNCTKNKQSFLF